jgi:hypothetical protein
MPERPIFPFYVNSKGRPTKQLTVRALAALGVPVTLVVEDAEHDAYAAANPGVEVIVWPQRYMDDYEKTPGMDPHPTTGVGRNFAWDHSRERGYSHHWILDDNSRQFYVHAGGPPQVTRSPTPFTWVEQWALRWRNLGGICLSQIQFAMRPKVNALVLNTRLYCATLITNELQDSGIRWRRGYNEDTITSIDILKTGYWCTAQTYVVSIQKKQTSRVGRLEGGMTQH